MPETIEEAIHRGNNLVVTVFLAVLAFGTIALVFSENELLDKADDLGMVVLGIIALAWYLTGRHRYQFSWTPLVLAALGLIDKVLALINEFGDPASVGDEYGYVALMVMLTIVSAFLLVRSRRLAQHGVTGALPQNAIPQTGKPKE